jgi:hypothetical protein
MQLYVEVGVTGRSETSAVAVAHGPGANHSRFEADRSVSSSADLQELNCASLRIHRRASWTQRHFSSSSYSYWFSAAAVFTAGGAGSKLLFRRQKGTDYRSGTAPARSGGRRFPLAIPNDRVRPAGAIKRPAGLADIDPYMQHSPSLFASRNGRTFAIVPVRSSALPHRMLSTSGAKPT